MEHRQLLETLVVDLLNSPINPLIQYRDFQIQHICKQIGVNEYGGQRDAIFFKHFASHFISYLNEKNELSPIISQAQITRNQTKPQELQSNKQIALPSNPDIIKSPVCSKPKNDVVQIIDDDILNSNKSKIDLEVFLSKSIIPVPNIIGVNLDINNNQFNKSNDNIKHISTKTASNKLEIKPKESKLIPDLLHKNKINKTPQKNEIHNKTFAFLEPIEFKETQLNRSLQSKIELQNNNKKKRLSPQLDIIKKKDSKPSTFKPDSLSESFEIRTSDDLSFREDSIKRKENIKVISKQEKKPIKELEIVNKKEKLQKIEKKKHSDSDIKQKIEKLTQQIIPIIEQKDKKKKEKVDNNNNKQKNNNKKEQDKQQQQKEKNQLLERFEREKYDKDKLEKEKQDKFEKEKEKAERLEKERQERIEYLEKQKQERERQDKLEKERQERLERSDKHRQKETQELELIIEKLLCTNSNETSKIKKNSDQIIIIDNNEKTIKKLEKEQSKFEKPLCNYCQYTDTKTIEIQDGVRICTQCLLVSINPFQKIITKLAFTEYRCSGKENAKTIQNFTIDNTSYDCNLEIRCVSLNKQGLYDLTFPMSCTLLINGITIKEIRPLQEKSSLKKRRDSSIYINLKDLLKQNNFNKKFAFSIIEHIPDQTYRKETIGAIYCFGLFLVEPLNVIKTIEQFKQRDIQPKIKADQSKKEIQVAKTIISLYCQFTLELIQIPAKGEFCQHEQCFCLRSYLEMMIKVEHKKWICPICKKVCFHLIIDKYQLFIIDRIKQLEISVDQIVLDHNGQMDKDEQINIILQDQSIKSYQDIIDRGYQNINKITKNEDEDDLPIVNNEGKTQNFAIILIDD